MSKQELITYINELFSRTSEDTALSVDINDQFKIFCINNICIFENKQNSETSANIRDFLDKMKDAKQTLNKAMNNAMNTKGLKTRPSKQNTDTDTSSPSVPVLMASASTKQIQLENEHRVSNKKFKLQLL